MLLRRLIAPARRWAPLAIAGLAGCGGDIDRSACEAFIGCAQHYATTFGTDPVDVERYKETGICWDDPAVAEACVTQCEDTMASYRDVLEDADENTEACE